MADCEPSQRNLRRAILSICGIEAESKAGRKAKSENHHRCDGSTVVGNPGSTIASIADCRTPQALCSLPGSCVIQNAEQLDHQHLKQRPDCVYRRSNGRSSQDIIGCGNREPVNIRQHDRREQHRRTDIETKTIILHHLLHHFICNRWSFPYRRSSKCRFSRYTAWYHLLEEANSAAS